MAAYEQSASVQEVQGGAGGAAWAAWRGQRGVGGTDLVAAVEGGELGVHHDKVDGALVKRVPAPAGRKGWSLL